MASKGVGARALDELQHRVAPLLEGNGFKTAGRCHYRVHEDRRYDVLELRTTIYGSAEQSRFTLEVYQHDVRNEDPHARRWKTFPTTAANVFVRNVGTFMPGGHQHWWELSEATDVAAIGAELETLLAQSVIPYFGSWGPAKRPFIVPAW